MKRAESLLLFLTLLFLPTQLGRHFWPDFSYVYSLKIDYLSPTIYFWDLLVVLLITVFLLSKEKINKLALNIFLLFFLAQIISIPNLGPGLVRLEQYLISGFFGVYLASKSLSQIKQILIWGLGLSILGQSLLAVLQFLTGGTLGLWILGERSFNLSTPGIAKFDFYGRQFLRPYGTFPHPNVLAAFLVLATIILLILKKSFRILIFLAAIPIFLTVSRVAIAAGFVAFFFFLKKTEKFIFILLGIILLPVLYTRFSSIFNFDNISLLRREELTEVAIRVFLSFPTNGVGLNNFIPATANELIAGPSRFLQPVHNIFLLTLSETGIIGLLGFLLLIYPIIKNIRLLGLLVIFLGLFDHFFLTLPQGQRLLFLVWGISFSIVQYFGEKSS